MSLMLKGASILGFKVSSLPVKYLGLLFGASFKAKSIWDDTIEKIHLARWKRMYQRVGELHGLKALYLICILT
jgi:hypothetical protein